MRRLVLALLLTAACSLPGDPAPSPTTGPTTCERLSDQLVPPVYHPQRLQLLEPCVLYRGVVIANLHEQDGDRHLWIAPDPDYERFLNPANVYHGRKALVAEIVPACITEPADEAAAARCPRSTLSPPPSGSHVEITGPWVLDTHHGWDEIHPVASIKILPRT